MAITGWRFRPYSDNCCCGPSQFRTHAFRWFRLFKHFLGQSPYEADFQDGRLSVR